MLDAIHERFRDKDCLAAWERLIDTEKPAISFHVLPIEQMGLSEDVYIKMNSRGKPLTPFENFKARFEQVLEVTCPERVQEFALKVDGAWSDLFWPYRGSDFIVDDEFLRYFQFVTEINEWHEGRFAVGDVASIAERVYGRSDPESATHLDFLFRTLDTWVAVDIPAAFSALFAPTPAPLESDDTRKVVLFGPVVDLFSACCQNYGQMRGRNRVFSWPHTIFLYAVLLHRIHQTEDFAQRLRVIRNLVEASSNELRLERMPALLADVRRIVLEGALEGVFAFNQAQVADEQLKAELLAKSPNLKRCLFHLEDHPVLRGCLAAFELDETVFEQRADAFHRLFAEPGCLSSITGALVASGDYSRKLNHRMFQFGSGSNLAPWRELLVGVGRSQLAATRDVLGRLLDTIAQADGSLQHALDVVQKNWLDATVDGDGLSWRWYFVKYPAMREGHSGIYAGSNGTLGYSLCMLNKTQMNSWYRDPYLFAMHGESNTGDAVEDPWFTGYETEPRWMRLKKSGTGIQCVEEGFVLRPPSNPGYAEAFSKVCAEHGVGPNHVLRVSQAERDGRKLDTRDRVQLGAALLRDLVNAGL